MKLKGDKRKTVKLISKTNVKSKRESVQRFIMTRLKNKMLSACNDA